MKIVEFLDELASELPTPGGGSVSALSGALGAGLVEMVCRLTVQKKDYEDVKGYMIDILENAEKLRERLVELVDEDSDAFEDVMVALSMPKKTPEEKKRRKEAIEMALKRATEVPMEVAEHCLEVIRLAKTVAKKGNKNAVTDAGVATLAANTGLKGAILNVRTNLASIKDENYVRGMTKRYTKLEEVAEQITTEVLKIVDYKLKT